MAFSFSLGGDDIDIDEDDSPASTKDQEKISSMQADSTRPVKSYHIGESYPEDDSTRSFVSTQMTPKEASQYTACLIHDSYC